MRAVIIGFGLMIFCLLILFRIGEVNFMKGNVRLEVIVAIAAIIFFFTGLYFNQRSSKQTHPQIPPAHSSPTSGTIDYEQLKKTGLTPREHEVLIKMAEGMSNNEIATSLFVSESTIKTHVSNILFKLDSKRRTQAIQVAREYKIVL